MNFANEYNNNNANSSRRTYGSIIDNIVSNNNNNNNTQRGEEYMDDPFAISEEEDEDDNNSDDDSSDHSNNAIFNLMSFSDSRIRIQGLVKKATRTPERKKRSAQNNNKISPRSEKASNLNSAVQTLNDLLDSVHNDTLPDSPILANISNNPENSMMEGGDKNVDQNNATNTPLIVDSPSSQKVNIKHVDHFGDDTIASPIPEDHMQNDTDITYDSSMIDITQSPSGIQNISGKNSPEFKLELLKKELEESRASIVRHVHSASKLRKQIHKNRRKYEADIKEMKKTIKLNVSTTSDQNIDDAKKEIATELMKQHREALATEERKHEHELRNEKKRFENYIEMDKEEKDIAFEFVLNKLEDFLDDGSLSL